MNKVQILGVGIDDVSLSEAVSCVKTWLNDSKGNKKYIIVTPNPEFLLAARNDPEFREILNRADLAIPDGAGLKLSGKITNVTPGVDLMEELCKLASREGYSIALIGGKKGVAERTKQCLVKRYPNLKIVFADSGPELKTTSDYSLNTTYHIPNTDILFVAFGQVKQEKWIDANLNKLSVKIAMGVGGAFDYISGEVPRAPKWMRSLGLEWLFRLIVQPWRIKRQLKLLKYVWLILKERL
jgi:N-acetylglucosaminyldiphosphoundecaprenol N-acetyl-beta-D-mannosaminyltransferase